MCPFLELWKYTTIRDYDQIDELTLPEVAEFDIQENPPSEDVSGSVEDQQKCIPLRVRGGCQVGSEGPQQQEAPHQGLGLAQVSLGEVQT